MKRVPKVVAEVVIVVGALVVFSLRRMRSHSVTPVSLLTRAEPPANPSHTDHARAILRDPIRFDFSQTILRSEDLLVLDRKIAVLRANPGVRLRIAGNCDERGSDDYNLALGRRRAAAAKQYLIHHGIEAGRIDAASYGKNMPLDPGHDPAAWATNRRDEFELPSGAGELEMSQ